MQPWGPDKARQSTLISEHPTAADTFAEIDLLASEMVRTGAPSDAMEWIVIDQVDRIVQRSDAHLTPDFVLCRSRSSTFEIFNGFEETVKTLCHLVAMLEVPLE